MAEASRNARASMQTRRISTKDTLCIASPLGRVRNQRSSSRDKVDTLLDEQPAKACRKQAPASGRGVFFSPEGVRETTVLLGPPVEAPTICFNSL